MSRRKCVCLLGISVLTLAQRYAAADPERPAWRLRISAASATYVDQEILFQIEFSRPFVTSHWEFQVFIDADNNGSTGYGPGWDVLIRGLDLPSKRGLVDLRSTSCPPEYEPGSPECPGGWGGLLQEVEFERSTAHRFRVLVPFSEDGLPDGCVRFAVEVYFDGWLVDWRYDIPSVPVSEAPNVPVPTPDQESDSQVGGFVPDQMRSRSDGLYDTGMRTEDTLDTITKALIETIGAAGYIVSIEADGDKNMIVEVVNQETGERFVVRAAELYPAAVELAVQVGIELEDG